MKLPNLKSYIQVLDDVMPAEMCEGLIELFDRRPQDRVERDDDVKHFSEVDMFNAPAGSGWSVYSEPMAKLMSSTANEYFSDIPDAFLPDGFDKLEEFEYPRIKRYEPLVGQFDWHTDNCNSESSQRLLVMFWYLNDVEEGGETVFGGCTKINEPRISVKPNRGRVVCFPPFFMFPHKGCFPISNPKYVISSYVNVPS